MLGVTPATLKRRTHDTETVADAFDRGRALLTKDVLEGLAARAKTGDPAAVKLYLAVMRRPGFTEAEQPAGGTGTGVTINVLGGPTGLEVNAPGGVVAVAEVVDAPPAQPQQLRQWKPKAGTGGAAVASAARALLEQLSGQGA